MRYMIHPVLLLTYMMMLIQFSESKENVTLPDNLAFHANIEADSEYNSSYAARYVADDEIPTALSNNDASKSWCVNGETHRNGALIRFKWEKINNISEIYYYGRTSWELNECWKDYEISIDSSSNIIKQGRFEKRHGPQRISLDQPIQKKQLTIRFTSSYGGSNPGAAEIEIYPRHLSKKEFQQLNQKTDSTASYSKTSNANELQQLIVRLKNSHDDKYVQSDRHEAQLKSISNTTPDQDLSQLQHDILLFDVDKIIVIKRHEILASHVYTYHYEGFSPGSGLYVFDAKDPHKEPLELVDSPKGQILDCDLSYDATKIMFSWRQNQDEGYHLWTINIDGANLTQLTDGPWHDYNACWLPDGGIAFLSTRSPQFAYCWHAPVGVVYRMNVDGSDARQLSANYLNDFTPYVLNDGRIIYSRWEYVDKPAIPIQSLWTIHPDGTNLSMYFGNGVLSPGTFMEARPIPGTEKIVCTMTGHNGPTRGAIGIIDRSKGVNTQEAITNITPDVIIPQVNQGNGNTPEPKPYSGPWPLDAERLLLSAQGPVLVRTFANNCQSIAIPAPQDGFQYFNPIPVRVRPRPPVTMSLS
jgi:F5/8 type C domain-containing protein